MNYTKDYLDVVLQDNSTEHGGISFIGETLRDFLYEVGLDENTPIATVNKSLIVCGIEPITDDCDYPAYDKNGNIIHKGDFVIWYDNEQNNEVEYEVYEEPTEEMVKLYSKYGECEALPNECVVISNYH